MRIVPRHQHYDRPYSHKRCRSTERPGTFSPSEQCCCDITSNECMPQKEPEVQFLSLTLRNNRHFPQYALRNCFSTVSLNWSVSLLTVVNNSVNNPFNCPCACEVLVAKLCIGCGGYPRPNQHSQKNSLSIPQKLSVDVDCYRYAKICLFYCPVDVRITPRPPAQLLTNIVL